MVVASAMNSKTPVAKLIAKPAHMVGNAARSAVSGMAVAQPSSRRSTTTLAPTTMARPTVWRVRMVA